MVKRKAQEADNTLFKYLSSSHKAPRKDNSTATTMSLNAKKTESSTSPEPSGNNDMRITEKEEYLKTLEKRDDIKPISKKDDITLFEKQPSITTISKTTSNTKTSNTDIKILEKKGDIFSAPNNTILLHACNCHGTWGAGIANSFRLNYPSSFQLYKTHCAKNTPSALIGTVYIIPPQPNEPQHYIACLFTSKNKGKLKDSPAQILKSTDSAMRQFLTSIPQDDHGQRGQVWMCKINSGLFNVPWQRTKDVITAIEFDAGLTVTVMER